MKREVLEHVKRKAKADLVVGFAPAFPSCLQYRPCCRSELVAHSHMCLCACVYTDLQHLPAPTTVLPATDLTGARK